MHHQLPEIYKVKDSLTLFITCNTNQTNNKIITDREKIHNFLYAQTSQNSSFLINKLSCFSLNNYYQSGIRVIERVGLRDKVKHINGEDQLLVKKVM